MEEIEKRLEKIEGMLKLLEKRIELVEDVHKIQNLMSRYEYYHTADMQEETVELFAKETPGVSAEIANWGVYEGIEGVRKLFLGVHRVGGEKARVGTMFIHTLTTPVIEVAGDGKTAKAVWISPGVETAYVENGKLRAYWAWCKYGCDFVKEKGEWKIWHFHVYPIFMTPYEKSWVEVSSSRAIEERIFHIPEHLKPDRPTSYYWEYSPTVKTENIPPPPKPYEKWDGKSVAFPLKSIPPPHEQVEEQKENK
ncbi:MAG: nuclear transport factor 2 family protein [Candidatus Bathyarchaeia archaeon]